MNYVDATILGGLPVVIAYEYHRPIPSVGDPGGVDLGTIYLRKRRKLVPIPEGMSKRMTANDWDVLTEACYEHAGEKGG